MAITFESFKALANDANVLRPSGDDTTVRLAQGDEGDMKLATGKWVRLGSRSDAVKAENMNVRRQLLKALSDEFGGLDQIPKQVRDALRIKDFALDENGVAQSQKPLSMRRIRLIVDAVGFAMCQKTFGGIQNSPDGAVFVGVHGATDPAECLTQYNSLSNVTFKAEDLFENHMGGESKRLTKAYTRHAGPNYGFRANTYAKACLQNELIGQLSRQARGEKTQFEGDFDRSNIVNGEGQLLSRQSVSQAKDDIANDLVPGSTYAQLSPAQRARVNIVTSLVHQNAEFDINFALGKTLDAEDGYRNDDGSLMMSHATVDTNLYTYSFDEDGGISVSLAHFKKSASVSLDYLTGTEGDIPEIQGNIRSITRMDVHIPAEEVDRLVTLSEQNAFAQLDGRKILDREASICGGNPPDPIAEFNMNLQPEFRINMDVRVSAKVVLENS